MKELTEQWTAAPDVGELARWFKGTAQSHGWFGRGPARAVLARKYPVSFSKPSDGGTGGLFAEHEKRCDFEIAATSLATVEMFVSDCGDHRQVSFVAPIAGVLDQMRGGGHGRQAATKMLKYFSSGLVDLDPRAQRAS
ncbi:MAG TPA: hypothetical protein VFJ64_08805 [Solirubrobacterales bacterium]|nr:hypothetical protein [Solirubrobacterales bacterium]